MQRPLTYCPPRKSTSAPPRRARMPFAQGEWVTQQQPTLRTQQQQPALPALLAQQQQMLQQLPTQRVETHANANALAEQQKQIQMQMQMLQIQMELLVKEEAAKKGLPETDKPLKVTCAPPSLPLTPPPSPHPFPLYLSPLPLPLPLPLPSSPPPP